MADKFIVDCTTGETETAPLTAGEVAEREAMAAQVEQERQQVAATDVKRSTIDQAITDAIADLLTLANAAALPAVPDGTMTTAQLSNALRTLRNEAQATRAGAQRVAQALADKIRLDRGDFDHLA